MSFIGSIKVIVKAEDGRVVAAEAKPAREVHVEKLMIGKSTEEAQEILSPLFALCPASQVGASEIACAVAAKGVPEQRLVDKVNLANHLELISEGLRFFVLQLGSEIYRNEKIRSLIEARDLAKRIGEADLADTKTIAELWRELRSKVSFILLDGMPESWDQDLLNGTIDPSSDSLSSLFYKLNQCRKIGWNSAALLNLPSQALLQCMLENGDWKSTPWNIRVPYLTGAVSRMREHPLVKGLILQDGNTAYTRIVARYVEVLTAADKIKGFTNSVGALSFEDNAGASLIQNSRGVLIHSVKLDSDKQTIKDYNIYTPTEINVTNSDAFIKSLIGLKADSKEQLAEFAHLVVTSYDPCTQIEVEVDYA